MGFTERVTYLTDHQRDQRLISPATDRSFAPHRTEEPHRLPTDTAPTDYSEGRRSAPKRREVEVGHPGHVPETWPTLLSREQLCAYIGVSPETLTKICPVRPLDLGANLVRYSRAQIDAWVATVPPRLMVARVASEVDAEMPSADVAESRTESALDRVRARTEGSKCRKKA